ncbi:hypothetical protein C8R45DRAFT_1178744 [Mycena sanguinolenta]|nr:hypothetical protein C8R45DRAFT_1178744 [Mycena sanguinolenta]
MTPLMAANVLSFANSDWIWTPGNAVVAFRKDFTPPLGKTPSGAEVIITAANSFNFYVNGDFVGSGIDGQGIAQRFCIPLLPSSNVFAVNASNTVPAHGGLIATILVTYSDHTTDTIVSDGTFRISPGSPHGFEQPSFNDTAWVGATVVGAYGNALWGTVAIPSNPAVLDLASSFWVWTAVSPVSAGNWPNLPAGSRAFRRTFTPAAGEIPANANILIAADDEYTLWVNGVQVGASSGANWAIGQNYVVNFASAPTKIVIAVLATNLNAPSPAGLLFSMEVNMAPTIGSPATRGWSNCTAGAYVVSDNSWLSTTGVIPNGFQQPGFDDSTWPAVVEEVLYSGGVWSTSLTITPASAPITI